jgi:hypothetical protein
MLPISLSCLPLDYRNELNTLVCVAVMSRDTFNTNQGECFLVSGEVSNTVRFEAARRSVTLITPSDRVMLLSKTREIDQDVFSGASEYVSNYAPFFLNISIRPAFNLFGWEIISPEDYGIMTVNFADPN